jgi:excisionase family DNA binding protein
VGVERDTTMRDNLPELLPGAEFESETTRSESTYPSVAALAADIGLSERSTRSALRRGEIPHIRVGRRFILPKTAIAEWLRTAGRCHQADRAPNCGGELPKLVASSSHSEVTVMRRN